MKTLEMKKIELAFDKMINNLAGNRFGREIYQSQVKAKIVLDVKNIISLPLQIEDIASSFIQGFYSELSEKYGKEQALEMMELQSDNTYVMEKIAESIEVYGV